MTSGVLYISYDGLLEPLGQSQVLAYLEQLAGRRKIHVVSFEKSSDWANAALRNSVADRLERAHVQWHPMRYHKRPSALATAYDIIAGSLAAASIVKRYRLGVVHARSYVAALMALYAKRVAGAKLLFDMRGFWADERVEGQLWAANGKLFRAAKNVERKLLLGADEVVTLTHASAREISKFPYLEGRALAIDVIPTGVDVDRFVIRGPLQHRPFTLGYVGSIGTWYLLDEMLRAFVHVRERMPDARLLFVNRGEHKAIQERAAAHNIAGSDLELVEASHAEVPEIIARMTAAMAIYRPGYSRIACAPTKIPEYLACGVPCLASADVGDVEEVLEGRRVGIAISEFSDAALRSGVDRLIELTNDRQIQQRCRETAVALFSLRSGVDAYEAIYRRLEDQSRGEGRT